MILFSIIIGFAILMFFRTEIALIVPLNVSETINIILPICGIVITIITICILINIAIKKAKTDRAFRGNAFFKQDFPIIIACTIYVLAIFVR
jgi:hypothetical protein